MRTAPALHARAFLNVSRIATTSMEYARQETIFRQGDSCDDVLWIQTGGVTLSVIRREIPLEINNSLLRVVLHE